MFTKLLLFKVVLPLVILLGALGLAPFRWAKRLREKIHFGVLMRRVLIVLLCVGALAYGLEYVLDQYMKSKEETLRQRQGGRTGILPPPTHGRPLRSP